ncbi:DUF1828 domain-containing protein [Lactococcus petauri]|uniref:DUF1828 domain-containing protein n=1 Tax=Lactococcus petauri TaxID=1940789 RepID=A0ABZ2SGW8_9LACT|nr:DUF1828 domain-containing protein [Lactococcus petauri]OAL09711.1 hypothetical protein A7X72_00744 [Lactococcus garvieae]MCV5951954.1 DUF1828 domain-containing protein [Lactococcus petauri]MCV5966495.1 DUF1828 domain-containing protein [Lactococcus petauri]MCV5969451.1 DUF1828 domain-containing protein [Lactococcus petauri]MCV5979809.1 DUF1828 domain-containing protein [Lactococcus petauri]
MSNANLLERSYFDWLMKEYTFEDIEKNIVRIDSPFYDTNFDYIVMYAEFHNNGSITVTDDGWTIDALESQGLSLSGNAKTRKKILHDIVDSLGVECKDGELCITTDIENFPIVKQRLLQAIMKINDMIVLKDDKVKNMFFEDVEEFLKQNNILFEKNPSFAGKGGITVQFDFSVPTNDRGKLMRVIGNGNDLNKAKLLTMDTRILQSTRPNTDYIAIIDNVNNKFTEEKKVEAIFKENTDSKIITLPAQSMKDNIKLLSNQSIRQISM